MAFNLGVSEPVWPSTAIPAPGTCTIGFPADRIRPHPPRSWARSGDSGTFLHDEGAFVAVLPRSDGPTRTRHVQVAQNTCARNLPCFWRLFCCWNRRRGVANRSARALPLDCGWLVSARRLVAGMPASQRCWALKPRIRTTFRFSGADACCQTDDAAHRSGAAPRTAASWPTSALSKRNIVQIRASSACVLSNSRLIKVRFRHRRSP